MNKIRNSDSIFRTSDFCLGSFLICEGFVIESIDKADPSRVVFIFERSAELDQVIKRYWVDKVRVSPLRFFQSIKSLKARIHSDN